MINVPPSILINLAITMAASFILFMFIRNTKSRVDNKMETMFQLVQAMATEVSSIKGVLRDKEKPVNPPFTESDNGKIEVSDSDSDESDDSDNESNTIEVEDSSALKIINNIQGQANNAEITEVISHSDIDESSEDNSSEEEFEIEEIKTINITDIADVHDDNSDKVASPSSVINSDVNTIHLEDEVIEVNSELIQEATLDKLNVKELKEKVIEAGGKPGKMNKGELIEYLQANN